jgi:hypothetical protein
MLQYSVFQHSVFKLPHGNAAFGERRLPEHFGRFTLSQKSGRSDIICFCNRSWTRKMDSFGTFESESSRNFSLFFVGWNVIDFRPNGAIRISVGQRPTLSLQQLSSPERATAMKKKQTTACALSGL